MDRRRPKDAAIQAKLDKLAALGDIPLYITGDATDQKSLQQAYEIIKKHYSRIDGIIHSAIVLLDRSLANMDEERFRAGLAAKVDVCVRLAQVFHKEPLDFVLFFSSMESFIKAPGQSNYASGCTFKDAFAHRLALEWPCPVKVINWGYWGSVGIVASQSYQERMAQAGFGSIEPPEAMEALEALLAGPINQIAFMKTTKVSALEGINVDESVAVYPTGLASYLQDIKRINSISTGCESAPAASAVIATLDTSGLTTKLQADLIQMAAQILGVRNGVADIDADAGLNEYGFDQIRLAEFTGKVNLEYGLELTSALFSEYPNLHSLAVFLVAAYREVFIKKFSIPTPKISEKIASVQLVISETSLAAGEMEELFCRLLWGQLRSTGMFTESSSQLSDNKVKIGLRDLYNRWFDESIAALARHNYLQYDAKSGLVNNPAPIDIEAVWREWDLKKDAWLKNPNLKAQAVLTETTLRALPDILTGKVPATDIMYPNSSMELVAGIFKNNIIADYFNEMVAGIVVDYLEARLKQDSSVRIRIIEIGAGTGGTSTVVFEKLQPYQDRIAEYCYTDISKAFLIRAETEYGPRNPYLTYRIFNVEKPIAAQSIAVGGYDLALATNVLHATKNIRQTIRNTKAALKKHGLILLNEMSSNTLFSHLTFGLLEGWWRYEDQQLRIPGCPGLTPETWQAVLESEGFRSVFFPARAERALGQQIIAAESDGVVRQQQIWAGVSNPVFESRAIAIPVLPKSVLKPAAGITTDLLREKSTSYFKKLIGETLKIPYQKIDSAEPYESYGIDSILVVQLANSLSKVLDNVSSTLFFEYQTIDELVEHFLKTQKEAVLKLVGLENQRDEAVPTTTGGIPAPVFSGTFRRSLEEQGAFYHFTIPQSWHQAFGLRGLWRWR